MRHLIVVLCLFAMLVLTGSLAAQDASETTFTVRIENVSGQNTQVYSDIGVVGVPVGATRAARSRRQRLRVHRQGAPGDHLSFASMYGQSNDTFFAPDENGIALFDAWAARSAATCPTRSRCGTRDGSQRAARHRSESGSAPVESRRGRSRKRHGRACRPNDRIPGRADAMHVTLTPVDDQRITVRIENTSQMRPCRRRSRRWST